MDHDRLLSGRVRARFGPQALQRAVLALNAAKRAAFDAAEASSSSEELEEALDAYRLIRGLQNELRELGQA